MIQGAVGALALGVIFPVAAMGQRRVVVVRPARRVVNYNNYPPRVIYRRSPYFGYRTYVYRQPFYSRYSYRYSQPYFANRYTYSWANPTYRYRYNDYWYRRHHNSGVRIGIRLR